MTQDAAPPLSVYLSARPGAHTAYFKDGRLVVKWYDFGDHAPYESANLLYFAAPAQGLLENLLRPGSETLEGLALLQAIADRFDSYWEVRTFAEANAIAFEQEVDFWP